MGMARIVLARHFIEIAFGSLEFNFRRRQEMTRFRLLINVLGVSALCLICSSLANAQATRTWVSGVGDDANPCSRTAPCKTFAGAISKTAACGEISVLDPGGYGAVTITKSITINGDGTLAGILAAGTNGVIVNAGTNDVVILRSLSINGACTGLNGIRYLNGRHLRVENCTIYGFTTHGIDVSLPASTVSQLTVANTSITNVNSVGIRIASGAAGVPTAQLTNVRINRTNFGLDVLAGNTTIANSAISHVVNQGIVSEGTAVINAAGVVLDNNGTGIGTLGTSTVNFANCDIFNNTTGINIAAGTTGNRFGNSRIFQNTTNETVVGALNLQTNR
jgi:hypothetical protein